MIRKLMIPKELGDSVEVRLLEWCKAEGDEVKVDDAVLEFETDKAVVLVSAKQSGALRRCFFGAGDWMKPGDVAAWLSDLPNEPLPGAEEVPEETLIVDFETT